AASTFVRTITPGAGTSWRRDVGRSRTWSTRTSARLSPNSSARRPTSCPATFTSPPVRVGAGSTSRTPPFLGRNTPPSPSLTASPPPTLSPPEPLTQAADRQRNALRDHLNHRFAAHHRSAQTEAYTESYEQAAQLMRQGGIFDITQEPTRVRDRYGSHDFGRH